MSLLLRKIKKSILFWGQPFSNLVKIKLILANTTSYVSLNLSQSAGNTHLFKLIGEISPSNVILKKNWIWDVLEVKWGNTCIILNDKEIHLPTTLLILFIHKIKVRKLFHKINLMHVYIKLKQRQSWYKIEGKWECHSLQKDKPLRQYLPIFLLPSLFIPAQFYFENFHFRMALLKSLKTAYNLNEYLFCKMPEGTLEIEIKVKTSWGKFTMIQNTHMRMERYCTWEKPQLYHVKSKKGKTPHKTASVHTEENTSETDMPTSQEFGYPTLIFNDPTHTAVMPHTDSEGEAIHDSKFLGRYCEYCNRRGDTHCWCFF